MQCILSQMCYFVYSNIRLQYTKNRTENNIMTCDQNRKQFSYSQTAVDIFTSE